MGTETVLLISGLPDYFSRFTIESIGLSLCQAASRHGGAGWSGWLESDALKVRLQGLPLEEIRVLMQAVYDSAESKKWAVSVVQQQTEATPLPKVMEGEIPWGTVVREKLTKKLLKLLPQDAYLVSNGYSGGEEVFSERLGSPETRERTWRRVVIARANNRLCRLVWTDVDFNGPDSPRQELPSPQR